MQNTDLDRLLSFVGVDKVHGDVTVSAPGGDVEGTPAVAVGQSNVRSELDEQLDQLEVSVLATLVKRRLTVIVVAVNVHLVLKFLEQPLEAAGVAGADRLLEDPLMRHRRCRPWTPCVDRSYRGPRVDHGNRRNTLGGGEETLRVTLGSWVHGM